LVIRKGKGERIVSVQCFVLTLSRLGTLRGSRIGKTGKRALIFRKGESRGRSRGLSSKEI